MNFKLNHGAISHPVKDIKLCHTYASAAKQPCELLATRTDAEGTK